jgi:phenylacetate-CoA ligase
MVRMDRITGRSDDMMIIRGVNVFPSQIEWALLQVPGLEPQYVIVVDRQQTRLDELEVRVEATPKLHSEGAEAMLAAQQEANRLMFQTLGLSAAVLVVPPGALPRSEGKAKRVIDRREL